MSRSRSRILVDKSIAAMVASLEVYNKPDFRYREETFAVLALNAWELLAKAKVLQESGGKLSSIHVYEKRPVPGGGQSKKKYIRRNRAGNAMTIGLGRALTMLENLGTGLVEPTLRANLEALTEVRDNAVHFTNEDAGLAKAVQEIGTASVQNFAAVVQKWFGRDLSEYNFYLMPLAFFRGTKSAKAVSLNAEERRLIQFVAQLHAGHATTATSDTAILMEMDVSFKRSTAPTTVRIALGTDPAAVPVALAEEDIRKNYPWDYHTLTQTLRARYADFKENRDFHKVRKPLLKNPSYVMSRYLDPGNPKSPRKDFYSQNVLNEFDKHYRRA
jgi:hypothetical protein